MPLRLRRGIPAPAGEPSNKNFVSGETVIGALKKATSVTAGDHCFRSITSVLVEPHESRLLVGPLSGRTNLQKAGGS
jgi:hypothetical protein